MGIPKAVLPVTGQLSLIEFLVQQYQLVGLYRIFVVHNTDLQPGHFPSIKPTWILNEQPEAGRMHSIRMGIEAAGFAGSCILHPVDQPFIDPATISSMIAETDPGSYVVPVYRGQGGHPVLVGVDVQEYILTHPGLDHLRSALNRFTRKEVICEDEKVLLNLNTMHEYHSYLNASGKPAE